MQHQGKIAIGPLPFWLSWMYHHHADKAHAFLGHGVFMGVIHEGAMLNRLEFVTERFTGFDRALGQPGNTVHAHGQDNTVPVHRCRHSELVGDIDADVVTLDRFDNRPRRAAIVAPANCLVSRCKVMDELTGRQVKDLCVTNNVKRGRFTVGHNNRRIVLARFSGGETLIRIDSARIPRVASWRAIHLCRRFLHLWSRCFGHGVPGMAAMLAMVHTARHLVPGVRVT